MKNFVKANFVKVNFVKAIAYITLGIIFTMLFVLAFKGCESEPSRLDKPSKLEVKSNHSLKLDSIQKRITDSLVSASEIEIKKLQIRDSIHKKNIAKLTVKYNALQAIVKDLTTVKVDSVGQIVIVPVIQYNALIERGYACDSLVSESHAAGKVKDSTIFTRTIELEAVTNLNNAHEQALSDQIALNHQNKRKLKRANGIIKKIPLITATGAVIGFVVALVLVNL